MPSAPPALAKLTYEAWVIRVLEGDQLKVLHAGWARGAGDVLVPLPWGQVRLLEEPVSREIVRRVARVAWRYPVWRPVLRGYRTAPQIRTPPVAAHGGSGGEACGGLFSYAELPTDLKHWTHANWAPAEWFLWWPARRGPVGWTIDVFPAWRRKLAPVGLVVKRATAGGATDKVSLGNGAKRSDVYWILGDGPDGISAPGSRDRVTRPSVEIPGWLDSDDLHVRLAPKPGEHMW